MEWLNAISPTVTAIATITLMVATIYLAKYTKGLWKATSEYTRIIQSQTKIMDAQSRASAAQTKNLETQTQIMDKQIELARSQNEIMQSQVTFLCEQNKILRDKSDRDAKIERYHRLLDEMNMLIAPLCYAVRTHEIPGGSYFHFQIFHPDNIGKKEYETKISFWDGIKKHQYLGSSKRLNDQLNQFYDKINYYYNNPDESNKEKAILEIDDLIGRIKDRNRDLQSEIQKLEKELGISNGEKS